jgi:hypothetical protein
MQRKPNPLILQLLALTNFALGAFDCWLTQRRIKAYGPKVELNRGIRKLSTLLGPEIAAILGVMIPVFGWSYGLYFFKLAIPLAFLTGFNLKRFFIQMTSIQLERDARVHKLLQELGSEVPPSHYESTSSSDPSNSSEEDDVSNKR